LLDSLLQEYSLQTEILKTQKHMSDQHQL